MCGGFGGPPPIFHNVRAERCENALYFVMEFPDGRYCECYIERNGGGEWELRANDHLVAILPL
jgi:hypothetical protein